MKTAVKTGTPLVRKRFLYLSSPSSLLSAWYGDMRAPAHARGREGRCPRFGEDVKTAGVRAGEKGRSASSAEWGRAK